RIVAVGKDEDNMPTLECVAAEDYDQYNEDPESVTGEELTTTEVKKATAVAADPYNFVIVADEKLDSAIAEHDGSALETAKAMQENIQESTFLFGGCLTKLYYNQAFR